MNPLQTLFTQWEENSKYTKEAENAYSVLYKVKDIAERNKRNDVLAVVLDKESRNAFNAGFYTAVQLLIGGERV